MPNLKLQISISKILSILDDKIALNNKINAELEQTVRLIYDYWFTQFDFPDAQGKPYKSSGGKMIYDENLKRKIPEKWSSTTLDKCLLSLQKGITTKYVNRSNLINLNQKVNRGYTLDRTNFKFLDEQIHIPEEKFAKQRDILINSLGQGTLGRVHYFCEDKTNIVVDQHIFILRPDILKLSSSYLYLTLSGDPYQLQIERQVTGSTGMQMLNASDLCSLTIACPETIVNEEFENIIFSLFVKIANNESQNEELSELRNWLLPMLMTGQVLVGEQ